METPLATALLLMLLWPAVARPAPPRLWFGWGLAAGLAGLARPEFLLLGPLAWPWLAWRGERPLRWRAGLPAALVDRLAHAHGTRLALLLGNARSMKDLGRDFGAGLTEAEVSHLVRHEWARSAQDILWRRTRLGLELPGSAVHDLQDAVAKLL